MPDAIARRTCPPATAGRRPGPPTMWGMRMVADCTPSVPVCLLMVTSASRQRGSSRCRAAPTRSHVSGRRDTAKVACT